jgi:hypothetical protein
MLMHPQRDRSGTPIEPARRRRTSTMAAGLTALIMMSGLPSVPAFAQGVTPMTPAQAPSLAVQMLGDGRVEVVAAHAPIDEVIRAVAAAAGVSVSTTGPIPRGPVSIEFRGRPGGEILTALMKAADIDYVLTARRLVMGAPKAGAQAAAAETPGGHKTPALDPSEPVVGLPELDRQMPIASASEPDQWPEGVEPANFGAPARLPQTRDALFLEVNGTAAVTLPAGVGPNVGPAKPPERMEPVYRAYTPSAEFPLTPPVKVELQAPPTIRVPSPVVVQFPPPPKP